MAINKAIIELQPHLMNRWGTTSNPLPPPESDDRGEWVAYMTYAVENLPRKEFERAYARYKEVMRR